MARDVLTPGPLALPEDGIDLVAEYVASIERELIRQSLERTGGNKGRAAQLLKHEAHDARGKAEELQSSGSRTLTDL